MPVPEAIDRSSQPDPASTEGGRTTMDGELLALRGALDDARRELARALQRIVELETSSSWRVTRPLRAARSVVERLYTRVASRRARTARAQSAAGREVRAQAARVRDAQESVPGIEPDHGAESALKLIAFYLPQFHPIPENDLFWGQGFTEWTNVVRARPLFEGHYQPRLPSDLGLYDLRVPEVLVQQAELAREHGVYGFCFYYYWFDGHRVLERPLEQLLASGEPNMPFCCCWANENWTRRWDGTERDVLLGQTYEGDWAERFIRDLLPTLVDTRYIRVDDAALLLVYRVDQLPDPRRAADIWRDLARREAGIELHLAAVQSFGIDDPREYGFDAAVEFPPHPFSYPPSRERVRKLDRRFLGGLVDYRAAVDAALEKPQPAYPWYRGVMPSWDNTPRRGLGRGACVFLDSTPEMYSEWLSRIADQTRRRSSMQAPLVFVNAWNEWTEGAHLEPCERWGRQYLEATRDALAGAQLLRTQPA